ncbi:MAG: type I-F CRISPR-associated protein Csy3 [Desulfobulbus sp.]|jgi:CRISPR-associated protein Csy3|uniref:type I-F CRISPR-associated protein Csy3 n=1 Tax=Desulfobulbus sp. TaxID=895 RepID=UPI002842ECD0|nr:type I-F CRISPR-associated protein Csy3 [Desulfobulbus sp.]MDR2549037.1 type I-F CRISPR-associated protein Csy3 [Desulfobulbus sp.]
MSTALKTASVLAFERKLDPSDALFSSGKWELRDADKEWLPVAIREKSVRGTISNRLKTKDQDPAKLDAAIGNPNLQTVDVSALPADHDTLKVSFTLRVLSGAGSPSACNEPAYREKLGTTVKAYVAEHGFAELGHRYAFNLANGRFLWRNRIGAEQVEVRIQRLENGEPSTTWNVDALALPLRSFEAPSPVRKSVEELGALIAQGLRGETHLLLQVTAFVRIGKGQEVFPSQELILNRGRGDKSKTLYKVNEVAAIHSQKIGNAIRSIDTWYPEASELGPIAVEPYGAVTTQGKAYRQPRDKMDFYTLLDNWMLKDKLPAVDQQHYVMAVLVRGGVFGDKD